MPTPSSTGKKSKKTAKKPKPASKPKARAASKPRTSQKVVTKVVIMGGGGSQGSNTTQLVDPYGAMHGGQMGARVVYQQPLAPEHHRPEHAVPVQPRAPEHHLPSKQAPDVRHAVAGALLMTRAYMEGEKAVRVKAEAGARTPAAPLKAKMDPSTLSPVPPPSPAATPSSSTSIRPSGRQYKRSEMLEMRKLQDSEGWLLARAKRGQ